MPLPPELADLEAAYAEILAKVDAGTLSADQAISTVSRLVVIDGAGIEWTVSLDTEPPNTVFLANQPGTEPAPADPSLFAPTPGFTAPAPAGGPADWMTTPPETGAAAYHAGDPTGAPFNAAAPYGADPAAGKWVADVAPPAPPGAQGAPNLRPSGGGGGGVGAVLAGLRSKLPFGGPKDSNSTSSPSMFEGRGRTIAFIAVAVVVVILARACLGGGGGEATGGGGPVELRCPKLTAEVGGIDGRDAQLLGCLDGSEVAGSPDGGPQVAFLVVTQTADGAISFNTQKTLTRGEAAVTAAALYRFAGGRPPAESVEVPLDGIDPALHPDVQLAANLGFIDPADLKAAEPATKGFQVLVMARALAAAAGEQVTGTSPASDTAGVSPDGAAAHGYLTAKGAIDANPGPFGFDTPLTATEWVRLVGPVAHHIKNPSAPPAGGGGDTQASGEGAAPALDGNTLNTAVTALTSGRPDLIANLIDGVDAASNETRVRGAGYAGLEAVGLQLASSAASVDGDTATSDLTVTDPTDGSTVATAKAKWKLIDGTWKLTDWPNLDPS